MTTKDNNDPCAGCLGNGERGEKWYCTDCPNDEPVNPILRCPNDPATCDGCVDCSCFN